MQTYRITIIGAGNMGSSLLTGLLGNGFSSEQLTITDSEIDKLTALQNKYHVRISTNNLQAIEDADVIVLAVKPQEIRSVCENLSAAIQPKKPLIISIAAGILENNLKKWLGEKIGIVRCMPNTPALIRCGASALFANTEVTSYQKQLAESILSAVSLVVWLDNEKQMDAVTALSGSGPAYVFLLIEILQSVGERLGLPSEIARLLTLQTVYGSGRMAFGSSESAKTLREKVTSKGGTTEAAIHLLEEKNIREIFTQALLAAKKRSEELATLFN